MSQSHSLSVSSNDCHAHSLLVVLFSIIDNIYSNVLIRLVCVFLEWNMGNLCISLNRLSTTDSTEYILQMWLLIKTCSAQLPHLEFSFWKFRITKYSGYQTFCVTKHSIDYYQLIKITSCILDELQKSNLFKSKCCAPPPQAVCILSQFTEVHDTEVLDLRTFL